MADSATYSFTLCSGAAGAHMYQFTTETVPHAYYSGGSPAYYSIVFGMSGYHDWKWASHNGTYEYFIDSQSTVSNYTTKAYVNTSVRFIEMATPIPIWASSTDQTNVGYLYFNTYVPTHDYTIDPTLNNDANDFTCDGNDRLNVPVTSDPANNISVDGTSTIGLDTVLEGANAISANPGAITVDGQAATSVSDVVRAGTNTAVNEDYPDITTESPWYDGIPILSDIIKWLIKIYNAIKGLIAGIVGGIISGIADLSATWFPDFDGKPRAPTIAQRIGNFFSPLILLLIAIMHLLAKIIEFLGGLYNIPATSSMLHPTMIQGLEWARGFTCNGVNLYGLVSGVISIMLGVVVFKLVRNIISGVGSASTYQVKGG